MSSIKVSFDKNELEQICRDYGVLRLAFFGSVVRSDFSDNSDVDVLVEFLPHQIPGLFRYAELANQLSGLFNRKVDLVTYSGLSKYIRDEVLAEAEVQFDKAG